MSIDYLQRPHNLPRLAYRKFDGDADLPTVLFLPGFKSDMEGSKAIYLEEQCKARGQSFIRFDYSGHGVSDGDFAEGTIGSWLDDALAIIDELADGSVILVGSSMGGWVSLLAAHERPERVAGLIGIAAAPDFTKDMQAARLSDQQMQEIEEQGYTELPNDYSDEPYIITKALIEDGNQRCLLDTEMPLQMPVRLVQGMKDADVEWQKAHRIKNAITDENKDVEVILVEEGDHRLSEPDQLELIDNQVEAINDVYKRGLPRPKANGPNF